MLEGGSDYKEIAWGRSLWWWISSFSGFWWLLQEHTYVLLGETGWRIHKTSLYYICNFKWIYNYINIIFFLNSSFTVERPGRNLFNPKAEIISMSCWYPEPPDTMLWDRHFRNSTKYIIMRKCQTNSIWGMLYKVLDK